MRTTAAPRAAGATLAATGPTSAGLEVDHVVGAVEAPVPRAAEARTAEIGDAAPEPTLEDPSRHDSRRREQQKEPYRGGDESGCDEQDAAGEDETAVDELVRRHSSRVELLTDSRDHREPCVLRQPHSQHREQHQEPDRV